MNGEKEIRLAYVIASADCGGGEMYLLNLLKGIGRHFPRPVVITLAPGPLVEQYRSNARVYELPFRSVGSLKEMYDIRSILRQEKITLVHSHLPRALLKTALAAATIPGIKTVMTMHGMDRQFLFRDQGRDRYLLINMASRISGLLADRVIAVCRHDYWHLTERFPARKVILVNTGIVDFSSITEPTDRLITIGFIGRGSPEKGIDVLKRVIADTAGLPVRWLIAGSGDLPPTGENVINQGNLDAEQRREFYRDIDVLFLPSFSEGMPLTVIEAFTFGVPVLASAVGGLPDAVIPGQNGWLFPVGDNDAAETIIRGLNRHSIGCCRQWIMNHRRELNPYEEFIDSHCRLYRQLQDGA